MNERQRGTPIVRVEELSDWLRLRRVRLSFRWKQTKRSWEVRAKRDNHVIRMSDPDLAKCLAVIVDTMTDYLTFASKDEGTTAGELVRRMGPALIGRKVVTEAFGEWPGGLAEVTRLGSDPKAPEIVFEVKRDKDGIEIGVFAYETIKLLPKQN